jgi:DNA-binding NarL/FixJ family response regulator
MIVDANAAVRRVIKQIFGNLADVIYECASPVDAFADYRHFNPDVVVMDLGQPLCDGIWATRQIVGLHPEAVVVIVAQYPDVTFRAAAQQAGARGFVLKDNLLDLRQWLQKPSD